MSNDTYFNKPPRWTKKDSGVARAEGWDIFNRDSKQLEIQKVDETEEKFSLFSDGDAVFHVYDNALAGSRLHRKALAVVLAANNARKGTAWKKPRRSAAPAQAAPTEKAAAVVRLEGGVVQDVVANIPIDVMVADYDVDGCDTASLPQLPSLTDTDSDETEYVPVDCGQNPQVYVDPAFTESLIRSGRNDFVTEAQRFTVFIQQANGEGTIHIQSYKADSPEAAREAAISAVMADWGEDDPDNLHVLGIAKGDVKVVEWNDLDG